MNLQRAILTAPVVSVLTACVQAFPPAALPKQAILSLDGMNFQAEDGPDLMLTRQIQPFGYDEGLLAKRVAEAQCAASGRRLSPSALGRYQAGAWVFAGGCV